MSSIYAVFAYWGYMSISNLPSKLWSKQGGASWHAEVKIFIKEKMVVMKGDTYVIMMFSVRQSTGLFMRTATPK